MDQQSEEVQPSPSSAKIYTSSEEDKYQGHTRLASLVAFTAIGSFLLCCAWLLLLGFTDGDWSTWKPATCAPDACFCELSKYGLVRQPSNTWSNMAFSAAGCAVLIVIAIDLCSHHLYKKEELYYKDFWFYAMVFAFSCYFLGVTSAFYHASLTFVGQFFDNVGMYFIVCWAFSYGWVRVAPKHVGKVLFSVIFSVQIIIFSLINIYLPDIRRYAFGAMFGVCALFQVVTERIKKSKINWFFFLGAIVSMGCGFGFWILDNTRLVCTPDSFFQGHSVWHMFGGLGCFFLFCFFFSEILAYRAEEKIEAI